MALLAASVLLMAAGLSGTAHADPPTTAVLTTLYSFSPTDTDPSNQSLIGTAPYGLLAAPDGAFYGLAQTGGDSGGGTVLKFQAGGTGFTVLHAFDSAIGTDSRLIVGSDGTLYGTEALGGANAGGAVYSLAPDGSVFTALHVFAAVDDSSANTDGSQPAGALLQGPGGSLYGETQLGGANGQGVIYQIQPGGSGFTVRHVFGGGTDGAYPAGGLIAGPDGDFYGVTEFGGTGGSGTIFKIAPDGSGYTLLYQFSADDGQLVNADGASPTTALTLGDDGLLYGETLVGGTGGSGVVFRLGTDGSSFSVLHAFSSADSANANPDGAYPATALVCDPEGNFYGTTSSGGTLYGTTADGGDFGAGSLFRVDLHRPATHVLWKNADGRASLWNESMADGTFTQNTYGPYPGWAAPALADGPDALTRLLWTNTDGRASLWSLDNALGQFTQNTYGPYTGWTAAAVSIGPDNTTHVLWNSVNGAASLWNADTASGTFTQNTYGPYAGWSAQAIADGPDDFTRVLWTNANGQMSLWSLDNLSGQFTQSAYGPYPGWTVRSVSVSVDNAPHVLWVNTAGQASLWNVSPAAGSFTQNSYGAYPGWTSAAVADGPDAFTRTLWVSAAGQISLWNLDNTLGQFTQHAYGPYAGWTAAAVSPGQ